MKLVYFFIALSILFSCYEQKNKESSDNAKSTFIDTNKAVIKDNYTDYEMKIHKLQISNVNINDLWPIGYRKNKPTFFNYKDSAIYEYDGNSKKINKIKVIENKIVAISNCNFIVEKKDNYFLNTCKNHTIKIENTLVMNDSLLVYSTNNKLKILKYKDSVLTDTMIIKKDLYPLLIKGESIYCASDCEIMTNQPQLSATLIKLNSLTLNEEKITECFLDIMLEVSEDEKFALFYQNIDGQDKMVLYDMGNNRIVKLLSINNYNEFVFYDSLSNSFFLPKNDTELIEINIDENLK